MKKIILVLFALCLFVIPAMAQTPDNPQVMTWEELEESFVEKGGSGTFYNIIDLGLTIMIPDGLDEMELSDESKENGYFALFANQEDTSMRVLVIERPLGVSTLEEVAQLVIDNMNAQLAGFYTINGFDALIFADEENKEVVCVIPTTVEGSFIQVAVQPTDNETMNALSGYIFGSLKPYEGE